MSMLILMAPMQIKKDLTIGNIYDLLLCDFYAKVCRMQKQAVSFPLLINVNGSPIEKLLPDGDLEADNIFNMATRNINGLIDECKKYHIDFDAVFRDDDNIVTIRKLLPKRSYYDMNVCPKCGSIYGSDFSIKECRRCKSPLRISPKDTFAVHPNKIVLLNKVGSTNFIQKAAKAVLVNFIDSLPDEYDIILERNRQYSAVVEGVCLDPRYTAISLLSRARQVLPEQQKIVHIHGNVVKKFTYYAFAFLPDEDIPNVDFMHGSIVDLNGKKVRNNSNQGHFNVNDYNVNKRELRAYFLANSAKNDVILDAKLMDGGVKNLKKFFVLANRVCEERNFNYGAFGIRDSIQNRLQVFYDHVERWNLPVAFCEADKIIHECWKIVKTSKITEDEVSVVKNLQSIYFG